MLSRSPPLGDQGAVLGACTVYPERALQDGAQVSREQGFQFYLPEKLWRT